MGALAVLRGTVAALIVALLSRLDGDLSLTWWAALGFGAVSAGFFFVIGVVEQRHHDR